MSVKNCMSSHYKSILTQNKLLMILSLKIWMFLFFVSRQSTFNWWIIRHLNSLIAIRKFSKKCSKIYHLDGNLE